MKESTRTTTLKVQKLIVALCALMAVVPLAQLIRGIHKEDTSLIKRGSIGSVLGVGGLGLSVVAYAMDARRKKRND